MKKTIDFVFLIFIVQPLLIFAQIDEPREWSDGRPVFSKIDSAFDVRVDSLIALESLSGSAKQAQNFSFSLSGLDWNWPSVINIESAEDIDYRNFLGTDLYIVTDADARRIIQVNPIDEEIVWEFKGESGTEKYLGRPVDSYFYSDITGDKMYIADQGRHRVIKVIMVTNKIEWQYGTNDVEGNGLNQLSNPADAVPIPDSGQVLICDKGNNRILLASESDGSKIWEWGTGELNNPVDIEYDVASKTVLITDKGNNRVVIYNTQTNSISWSYGESANPEILRLPSDADFLPNGNILICDTGNNRLIEVNSAKEIVWEYTEELVDLKDADRMPDNKHLIVSGKEPSRLGYTTNEYISKVKDVGRQVNFNSISWDVDIIPGVTSVKFQLRSENTLGDLESAPWLGPTQSDSFYTVSGTATNTAHDGHRFYQFKAILLTDDPLYTSTLKDLILNYIYYDTETRGKIVTNVVQDSTNYIITRWKTLKVNTVLPGIPANRDKVEIRIAVLDTNTNESLATFTTSTVDTLNEFALYNIERLKQKQAIKLMATFKTNNASVTPAINLLSVEWDATYSTDSEIKFVDGELNSVSYYRFSKSIQEGQQYIDRASVFLNDDNLEQVVENVQDTIRALKSGDYQVINLIRREEFGGFLSQTKTRGIIIEGGIPSVNDGFLEVLDRDTLVISYTDPTNPLDQAADSVFIIQDTAGKIQFEDMNFTKIDSVSLNDTINVHIIGEKDRNISLAQDTVSLVVYDSGTQDEETIFLAEIADTAGNYDTGDFYSIQSLTVKHNNTSIIEDGNLQTKPGSFIRIIYNDTYSELPILTVRVAPGDTVVPYFGDDPIYFDVAPNPFRADVHNDLKIRIASAIGELEVIRIEIFSLSGERIMNMDGSLLNFNYYPIPKEQYGYASNWWDFRNQNGTSISSGTYFIKVHGRIVNSGKHVSLIKKLLLIR